MRAGALLLASMALFGCASEVAWAEPPPGPDAREVLETRCTGCHGLGWVCGESRSEVAWAREVQRMRGYGARITPEEEAALVSWLATASGSPDCAD